MLDLILSKTMYEYMTTNGLFFTDAELATVIFQTASNVEQRHFLLQELANKTEDFTLKTQIQERIAYDKKCLSLIQEHTGCFYEVYMFDESLDEWETFGYFATLELAKAYGMKKKTSFDVNKYFIAGFHNENISENDMEESATSIATISYNKNGTIRYFYTMEIDAEETNQIEAPQRFETRFIKVPNPFAKGDIVRSIQNPEHIGVVETSPEEWEKFLQSVTTWEWREATWHDASLFICFFNESLEAFHDHINPLLLEKVDLQEEEETEALQLVGAASDLLKGMGSLSYLLYLYKK